MNDNFLKGKEWKAASYVRLSREDGDKEESDSISNQKELIRYFIHNKPDIKLISAYEDDGYSGVNFERPQFKRMIEDIQNGLINCIIVKDLSRLGRNYIETGKLLERFFPFMGVRFIAINDSYDSQNHNSQTDNLIIPFKNLINDAYCKDISTKIRSQFEVKRKKGDFIGSFAAYGYLKSPDNHNRLIIDENTAPVVRDIFKWKIEGMSQQGIADRLNDLGILSPLEYKKAIGSNYTTVFSTNLTAKWTPVAIGRILKNDLYIGVLTQGISTSPNYKIKQRVKKSEKDWIRIEQSHESIISAEDFALVASLLNKDTRIAQGKNTVYLFSGVLYCADCERNLVRKTVPRGNKKHIYHVCATHKKGMGCTNHTISDKALYDAVFEILSFHISRCAKISRILDFIEDMPFQEIVTKKLQQQIEQKQVEFEKLERLKVKLYKDYSDGLMSKKDYIKLYDVFTEQTIDLEKVLENIKIELDGIVNKRGEKCQWVENFKKYHNIQSLTRSIIVELIDRITVYENKKIEVVFRYQQSFESVIQYIESLPVDNLSGKAVI